MKKNNLRIGLLFILPAVIVFILFKYWPIFMTLKMSFYDWNIMQPPGEFVGLANYKQMFDSTLFWTAWKNNIMIFGLAILVGFWVPLVQAIFLNEIKRGHTLFKTVYLIPLAVPIVVILLVWKWMYHPDYGMLNHFLNILGLPSINWLGNPNMAKLAVVLPTCVGGGIGVLIYLAAIQNIPNELLEAATLDGAGPWRKFRSIVFPNIRFVIMIQFILAVIVIFQMFTEVWVMTGGGPVDATRVVTLLIYRSAFENFNMGYASAIAISMFIFLLGLLILHTFLTMRESEN